MLFFRRSANNANQRDSIRPEPGAHSKVITKSTAESIPYPREIAQAKRRALRELDRYTPKDVDQLKYD
jgi:hypothetical protein